MTTQRKARFIITKSRAGHYTVSVFNSKGQHLWIQNKLSLEAARAIGRAMAAAAA